ncbi:MAG: sensor histidine kinase [Ramlibacter sp.]
MIVPAPAAASVPGFPFRRLVRDMGYASVLSLMFGLFITIVVGESRPAAVFEHLVYAQTIGMVAFLIMDAMRLVLLRQPNWGLKQWIRCIGLVVAAAPVSAYAGILLANLILGYPLPSVGRMLAGNENQNILITGFGGFIAMLLFANQERIAHVEAEAASERARAEAVTRQAMQAQLQLLQAQVEPHMLFNTLANLKGLIALDPDRAGSMLDQLIRFLRATLSSSRADATTLAQEFDLLDAYLGLMQVRMGPRLRFSLQLPDDLRTAAVPPMLLQPLVENAIIHGLEPKVDGGAIAVTAVLRDSLLELTVCDTGLGLDHASAAPGCGVGLANTRDRLRGLYGERAVLALGPSAPQGATARITLPLEFA